ncbi:hypothetical protein N2E53_04120 [Leuconostoc citreum]
MHDLTKTWEFFGPTPEQVARQIEEQVRKETGIYLTIGIDDSLVVSKIPLNIEANHYKQLIAVWNYDDVLNKLWAVTKLNDIWSIGNRTAIKLDKMDIFGI